MYRASGHKVSVDLRFSVFFRNVFRTLILMIGNILRFGTVVNIRPVTDYRVQPKR